MIVATNLQIQSEQGGAMPRFTGCPSARVTTLGARTLATPTLMWRQPDPMAHDYPGLSPYTFCAANPIRYSDPTGMYLKPMAEELATRLLNELAIALVHTLISDKRDTNVLVQSLAMRQEIKAMRESDQAFDVEYSSEQSSAEYERATTTFVKADSENPDDRVVFTVEEGGSSALAAHEFKHGHQFINGEIDLEVKGVPQTRAVYHDVTDEKAAYDRGAIFGGEKKSITDIQENRLYKWIWPQPRSQKMFKPIGDHRTMLSLAKGRAFTAYGVLYKP